MLAPPAPSLWSRRAWPGAVAIAAAALAVYWPALHGSWLWDDDVDILKNTLLRSAAGLWQIWFAPPTLDYYPLKFTVQWLQWQLWGPWVAGYHATNLALHALSALLLWRVFARLGLRWAWLGALAFTVHPLAVESVAWMAELKNALSLPPLLLALLAWLDYAASGRRADYLRALGWFLAALLCKTSVVMFPVTLALLTWWRNGRLTARDGRELAPFFVLSLALGLVTLWFQAHRGMSGETLALGGLVARLSLAGTALAFYLWKSLWPAGLLPIYPQWPITPPALWHLLPWILGALAAAWCWHRRATWGRHALLGGGWFVLHLLPCLGLVTISFMRFTWVMDHFAYVALPGLIGLAITALARVPRPQFAAAGGLVLCLLLGVIAHRQAATYRDPLAFWSHAARLNPSAWVACNNHGLALAATGNLSGALREYEAALQSHPAYFEARTNLGNALVQSGRPVDAIPQLQAAAQLQPTLAAAHYNLGLALQAAGRREEALASFNEAVQRQPGHTDALDSRGELLRRAGRLPEALRDFSAALRLNPSSAEAHHHLALLHSAADRPHEALPHFAAALRLRPAYAEAANNFAATLVAVGRIPEAIGQLEAAVALRPDFADARCNLGLLLASTDRARDAIPHLEAAVRLQPASLLAHYHLANALLACARPAEAIPHYERAREIDASHAEIHARLARALAAVGRRDDAQASYARARRLDPSLPAVDF